ncbi:hypothetical protein PF002_g23100 [Phytophthora fragariae]|nr:hypothetical protein PF009_g22970 [Phytophthora fragariae]KAE8987568.1 hypothetical protein PR001_g22288 [Phytophthora rubi]KAE9009172.1 hypothetical protein PR002_g15688 [Phytophthora rubi]KAE9107105.1 hypothetical protein PF006_g21199 [Phytophthora fragariae]KAE9193787.1 hypothetical protein PF004_g20916 [Phytophthora fragariae]
MVETSAPECAIQIVEADKLPSVEFKPLTRGQLLLKTRHYSDHHQRCALLDDADDDQDARDADEDPGRECFLSRFLAASMTLLVCCFIYFVVVQHWFLRG